MNRKRIYTFFTLLALLLTQVLSVGAPIVPVEAAPAAEDGGAVRFVVTGDTRGGDNGVNTLVLGEIAAATIAEGADFILVTGDLVNGSTTEAILQSQLTTWRDTMQSLYDDPNIGVYPCRGNHDTGSKTAWDNVFTGAYSLPGNGPTGEENITFSFTEGNVFVAGLDEYGTHNKQVNQTWLDAEFDSNTQPHVFVFGHEPAFDVHHPGSLSAHPDERNAFWNSIVGEGGRTYFAGHDHMYNHARIDDGDGDLDNDAHQFVVATGGAPLYTWDGNYDGDNGSWTPTLVYHEKAWGYALVEVDGLDVTITWKHRTSPGVYEPGGDVFTYSVAPEPSWTAYNDLAAPNNTTPSGNFTVITTDGGTNTGLPHSGELVDFDSGDGTGVTLAVTGGDFNGTSHTVQHPAGQSGEPAPGTDAYDVFNGKVDALGTISYEDQAPPSGNLVLTFTGMDPSKAYNLVFYGHRDNYAWDRASLVTLSDADGFTNESSTGTDNNGDPLFSGPSDNSTRLPADNDDGYVARFTDIGPGSDGQVVLTISYDGTTAYRGKYANALMLQEFEPPPPPSGWAAYNDLAWGSGQLEGNITKITSPNGGSGLPYSGELVKHGDGSGTGVSLTVAGGDFNGTTQAGHGAEPASGTDAHSFFDGKLSSLGTISYQLEDNLELTFTGMDPTKRYNLVFHAHRDNYAWDRASLVTISDVDAFTNESSAATDNPTGTGGTLFDGPGDSSTRLPADNDNGYVARFTNVDPGSDGDVLLTISYDGTGGTHENKGKYASAVMLQEVGEEEPPPEEWTAYNDLAWGDDPAQLETNITKITTDIGGSGLDATGLLLDYDTGASTEVTLSVTGGSYIGGVQGNSQGAEPDLGTDAYNVFSGKASCKGAISYGTSDIVLTFSGMDPSKAYNLAFFSNRDSYGWDRASFVTIGGADAFTNESSSGTDNELNPLFSGPDDSSTKLPSANTTTGYIARFTGIRPGSDGEVVLTISDAGTTGSGRYASALMLQQVEPPTDPTITVTGVPLSPFSSEPGTPSAEQSYTVVGSNLTDDIAITAPADFEVSTTSGSGFGPSLTLSQSGGSVPATPIYVRFNRATEGTSSGDITHVSSGAATQNVAVSGEATLLQMLPIEVGDDWRYFKGTVGPGAGWNNTGFDDSSWLVGPTGIGYADGDDATVLGDMQGNYISVYARKEFTVDDPGAVTRLLLSMDYDDGFVAYLNGVEVARANVTGDPPAYDTPADSDHEASGGHPDYAEPVEYYEIDPGLLAAGTNVLAVQGHNKSLTSSDFSLIPALEEVDYNWIAYVDLRAESGDNNHANVLELIPTSTYPNYVPPAIDPNINWVLKDFDTGNNLPVTMKVTMDIRYPTTQGADSDPGTDAGQLFGGIVDGVGGYEIDLADTGDYVTLTFDNLDPGKEYVVAVTYNRNGGSSYNNRATKFTLSEADTATNASSAGVVVNPDGSVSFCTGNNTANGYVAKWTGVTAADGSFSITAVQDTSAVHGWDTGSKGYAMTSIVLQQAEPSGPDTEPPSVPTDLAVSSKTDTSLHLTWTASTDNVGVAGYEVYRDGVPVGTTSHTNYTDGGLTPDTGYVYTVKAYDAVPNVSEASDPLAVTTNASTETVSFAVVGDIHGVTADTGKVADLIKSWNPDLVLTTGDNVDNDTLDIDDVLGQFYHEFVYPYAGGYGAGADTNRFFPTLGNHDWDSVISCSGGTCSGDYLDYFTLPAGPGDERYYDFTWGPVHFFVVDSDSREPDGRESTSTQAQWLRDGLAASSAPWKLVFVHHPPYVSGGGMTPEMQWPYQAWGATTVLAGHHHAYERIVKDGFPYFVNGLGGWTIHPLGTPIDGSQASYDDNYGAMLLEASDTSITFSFYSIADSSTPIDTYTLEIPTPTESLPIEVGEDWRYCKGVGEPPSNWNEIGFNDASWAVGPTGIGYGDGDDATVLDDMQNSYWSVYAREEFTVADPSAVTRLVLSMDYDDGFVAYLNGVEVARANMTGTPAHDTPADGDHEASGGNPAYAEPIEHFYVDPSLLEAGTNVLAVQAHNESLGSSDLSMIPTLEVVDYNWIAYVDLRATSGDSNHPNVLEIVPGTPDPQPIDPSVDWVLKDFDTGVDLPATMSVDMQVQYPTSNGGDSDSGTDADQIFGGIVDGVGGYEIADSSGDYVTLTLDDLDPGKEYVVAVTYNRNKTPPYTDRATMVTLSDADSYVNASSAGVVVNSEDSVSFVTGDNFGNGYVAKWTGVTAADGSFSITAVQDTSADHGWDTGSKGYAMTSIMLQEVSAPPSAVLGDVNGDDMVNSTDALLILSCDVGIDTSSFCPMNCGDVNDDGWINSTDALIILSYDVGMAVSYPVGEPGCPLSVTPCPGCNP